MAGTMYMNICTNIFQNCIRLILHIPVTTEKQLEVRTVFLKGQYRIIRINMKNTRNINYGIKTKTLGLFPLL